MRSVYGKGLDDWDDSDQLREADAALFWQRIAPPFAGGTVEVSEEILADEWTFQENEFWYQPINGRTIHQARPQLYRAMRRCPRFRQGKRGQSRSSFVPLIKAALIPSLCFPAR